MTMTKREKILIFIVLILAVLCVYYIYFLQPCFKELDNLNSENALKESTLSTNEMIEASTKKATDDIEEIKNDIALMNGSIMQQFDQPAVLVYLDETIRKHANKIMYDFEEITIVGQLKVCQVKVTMITTYENLKAILKSLQQGEYFASVVGLEAKLNVIIEIEDPLASGTEDSADKESPSTDSVPSVPENSLAVGILLEFYNTGEDIPPDREYPFSNGHSYGGDIFY